MVAAVVTDAPARGGVRVAVVAASMVVLAACGGGEPAADGDVADPAADDGPSPDVDEGTQAGGEEADPQGDDAPVDDDEAEAAAEVEDDTEAAAPAEGTDDGDSEAEPAWSDRDEPWAAEADGSLPTDFVLPPMRLSEASGTDHLDYLEMLHDACELENMGACDALRLVAPLAGEHHQFGEDCGGHREPDGSIFQDCRRHRPTAEYAANAGAQITDEASAAAWWDDRQLHDPVLIAEFCRGFGLFREGERSHDGFRLVFLRVEEEVEGLDLDRGYRADFEQFADDRCAAGR